MDPENTRIKPPKKLGTGFSLLFTTQSHGFATFKSAKQCQAPATAFPAVLLTVLAVVQVALCVPSASPAADASFLNPEPCWCCQTVGPAVLALASFRSKIRMAQLCCEYKVARRGMMIVNLLSFLFALIFIGVVSAASTGRSKRPDPAPVRLIWAQPSTRIKEHSR